MKKIKISACLITKNEELLLENCLSSIKDVADEIIILDTGSTDRTLDIVRGLMKQNSAIKLYETKWENNFAKARNESISYACGDWILCIDADETLSKKTQQSLPDFLAGQPLDQPLVFELVVTAPVPGNDYLFGTPYYKGSLFRNGLGLSFKRTIHEQLVAEKLISLKCPFLEIYHHEFLKPPEFLQKKQAEYADFLKVMLRDIDNIREKCYYWLNLAQSYALAGDSKNALKTYFLAYQAFTMPEAGKKDKVYLAVLEGISNELIFRKEDFLRALKYINEILMINPDSVTGYYLLGYSQHFTGLINDAVFSLKKALNLFKNQGNHELQVPYDNTVLANILCELARCLINQGNDSEGLELLTEVLEIVPEYLRALLYLEKYFLLKGDLAKAVYYHLQNDYNYTEDQKELFKQISILSSLEPDYKKLLKQMLNQLLKLPAWTDKERDEVDYS